VYRHEAANFAEPQYAATCVDGVHSFGHKTPCHLGCIKGPWESGIILKDCHTDVGAGNVPPCVEVSKLVIMVAQI
jgi:hypothetical protein